MTLRERLEDLRARRPAYSTEIGTGAAWMLEMCRLMLDIAEATLKDPK